MIALSLVLLILTLLLGTIWWSVAKSRGAGAAIWWFAATAMCALTYATVLLLLVLEED